MLMLKIISLLQYPTDRQTNSISQLYFLIGVNTATGKCTLPQTNYFLFQKMAFWEIVNATQAQMIQRLKRILPNNILEAISESLLPIRFPHISSDLL